MEQGLRPPERQPPGSTIMTLAIVTGLLLLVRLWLDRHLELMFDEAYYALWSKSLAWCYLDHPPMVALWIRVSTWLFGEHELGIRALGTLAAAAGGPLVYLVSLRLFASRTEAAFAGLLHCSMLLIAAGAIIITPDTPLLFFWSIAIYAVIRIYRDGDWRWWVVAGAAMGLALQSKYTAVLLGAGIVTSMIFVPAMRRWWRHPAPYAAGVLALAIFAPVIAWNYEHGWVSFAKQFARTRWHDVSLRYVGEFLGSQIGLLTPFIFVLAAGGVWISLRGPPAKAREPSVLLVSLIGPMLVYFLFHSLHARVEGNWLAPAYPVLAVLGAQAAFRVGELHGPFRSVMMHSRQCALPVGFAFAAVAYLQAFVGLLPLAPGKDPTALMVGWSGLALHVDDVARQENASYVLTSSYGLTSLLSRYSPDALPIVQFNERIRWLSFEPPRAGLFLKPGLYVSETNKDKSGELQRRFSKVELVGSAVRLRGTEVIKQYVIYRLAQPVAPVLDPVGR
jgi:4-amino-4-deoxy-L-arabinose transferase-like glycosyltransferase